MPSQSEADRILREHQSVQDETDALQPAHDSLESRPFDAAAHRAHRRRISEHPVRPEKHATEQTTTRHRR